MTKCITVLAIILLNFFTILWIVGSALSSPAMSDTHVLLPVDNAENVFFEGVHGWYSPVIAHKACVLLMHGNRGSKLDMVPRALFLNESGYSTLAIDLQAHGETQGEHITYGYLESKSAYSATQFLRETKRCKKVIALGVSLGGASAILGNKPIEVDGYILESVYSTIEVAVENRLDILLGSFGHHLAPLLYLQIPLRLGIDLHELQPILAVKNLSAPALIMNGTEDKRTSLQEAKLLYQNIPTTKTFVAFPGAAHIDLHQFNPIRYHGAVLHFLSTHIDGNIE